MSRRDDPRDTRPTGLLGWARSWAYGEADRNELGDRATRSLWPENSGSADQRTKAVRHRARKAKRG